MLVFGRKKDHVISEILCYKGKFYKGLTVKGALKKAALKKTNLDFKA